MRILVTGAAGFIGSKTAELLLRDRVRVTGIDDLSDSCDVRLKKVRLGSLFSSAGNFKFHKTDLRDLRSLRAVFRKSTFDAVIHLGARAGVRYSLENPFIYASTNFLGTLNILELCKEFGVPKVVFASTSSLYTAESSRNVAFREDSPANTPISPYAATKKGAESLCYTYHYLYGIDVTVLRYFTVYGPAGRPDMSYFKFIQQIHRGQTVSIYGDGRQKRDFTYVDDIARGTVLALKKVGFKTINLGGGKRYELNHLIGLIERALGQKAKIKYLPENKTDIKNTWANTALARKILRWRPRLSLEEGVDRAVRWHLANERWLRDIALR